MTTLPQVIAIVRCADAVPLVFDTLLSLERQKDLTPSIVLVTDSSTPGAAREWLTSLAGPRAITVIHSPSPAPGAVKNAALRRGVAADYAACLDAGDIAEPDFLSRCIAALDNDGAAAFAVPGLSEQRPDGMRYDPPGDRIDRAVLIGNTASASSATLVRLALWTSFGGFDEDLPALDHFEFLLRLAAAGHHGVGVDVPLVLRPWREGGLYRRAWEEQTYVDAMATIVSKHAGVFATDPAAVLSARERQIAQLAAEYSALLQRRDQAIAERGQLAAEASRLRDASSRALGDHVEFGDLRRVTPVARDWGYERGLPVDRHYIEQFLGRHASDIRGAVLEVQEPDYTVRFGGGRVTRSDVVDISAANPRATVVADLRCAANIPSNTYDCIILTQTLHVIDDMERVLFECHRLLKPGGTLLATLPCASRVCLEYGERNDFWRLTAAGARRLFGAVFSERCIEVQAHGNVLTTAAFLYGLGAHELTEAEFSATDPFFPLLVSVRAIKDDPGARSGSSIRSRAFAASDGNRAAILLYHRVAAPAVDVHGLAVTPEQFAEQMSVLRREYQPLSLAELLDAGERRQLPPRAVAVTFDDGYVDNLTDASPILIEHEVPATFFITTEELGRRLRFWWDVLQSALLGPGPRPSVFAVDLPDGPRTLPTTTALERRAAHDLVYQSIVASSAEQRDRTLQALRHWAGVHDDDAAGDSLRMSGAEVAELARRPRQTIGAHGVHHLALPRQTAHVQRDEISSSRRSLEALIGTDVSLFAYPFGAVGRETQDAVRHASFRAALTCEEKPFVAGVDPMRVPRFQVTPARAARFAAWLNDALSGAVRM